MDIDRFSASGLKVYESCPARFKAEYVERARISSGVAADLGTATHEALMEWTIEDMMEFSPDGCKKLLARFDTHAARLGLPEEQQKQGRKMLTDCYDRLEENPPYTILAVEEKETVKLKVGKREVDIVYIWDRCDQRESGAIEVVDYNSWFQALDPVTAKNLVQVRIYALTAAIKYKDLQPPAIWVTLDQLRYGTISVKFTKDDLREILAYLKDVIRRIWADDGTEERVNPECQYCIRKESCDALKRVINANPDGVLATNDFDIIGEATAEAYEARKALSMAIETYEDWLDSYLEEHQIPEAATETGVVVKYSATSRRKVDSERIAHLVGPEIAQRYGKFTMEDIDNLLKGDEIDDEVKDEIKAHIQTNISTRVTARYPKK